LLLALAYYKPRAQLPKQEGEQKKASKEVVLAKAEQGWLKILKSKIKVILSKLNVQQIFFIWCKIHKSKIANIVYYYFYIFIFVCF
jgi:hypothetical protein